MVPRRPQVRQQPCAERDLRPRRTSLLVLAEILIGKLIVAHAELRLVVLGGLILEVVLHVLGRRTEGGEDIKQRCRRRTQEEGSATLDLDQIGSFDDTGERLALSRLIRRSAGVIT